MKTIAALAAAAVLAGSLLTASPALAASSPFHGCGANSQVETGGFIVQNNAWNGSHGPECITVSSYHSWFVTSTQRGTAVETYPDTSSAYYQNGVIPYAKLSALRSNYAVSMPASSVSYIAEAAYDVWLNDYGTEVMAWTDNHGQTPAGNPVHAYSVYGVTWTLWVDNTGGDHIFSFVRHGSQPRGTVHILSLLRILVARHNVAASATVTDAQFGFEICSTAGVQRTFALTGYSLDTETSG